MSWIFYGMVLVILATAIAAALEAGQ